MQRDLDRLKDEQQHKEALLRQKQMDIQRKQDALMSSQTEMKRIEVELNEFRVEQSNLDRVHKDVTSQNRHVEKNFYAESKRQDDLESRLKSTKFEVDQLEVRKGDLVRTTDKLSQNLKESIERSNNLKQELSAVENLVKQYEMANKRIVDEMDMQAR